MTASFIFDLSAALSAEGDLRRLLVCSLCGVHVLKAWKSLPGEETRFRARLDV
jgi:hypothetical protein